MEENKKSSKLSKIITCLVVVLLVFSLMQNANLNDKIENLSSANSRLNSEINLIRNDIKSIYSNVDEQLKEQASIISGFDYSIGKPSKDMKTVPLTLKVVPKIITDDMKLSVTITDVTSKLTRKGSVFSCKINIGLFEGYEQYPLLTIESSDGIKTEYIEDINISYLFTDYLPTIDAHMNMDWSRTSNGTLRVSSILSIQSFIKSSDVNFTSFSFVEELNGKEIGREDITAEVLKAGDGYSKDYNKSFEVDDGFELRIYVEAVDSLGYIHKNLADCIMQSQMDAMMESIMDDVTIYDTDGNMLYTASVY